MAKRDAGERLPRLVALPPRRVKSWRMLPATGHRRNAPAAFCFGNVFIRLGDLSPARAWAYESERPPRWKRDGLDAVPSFTGRGNAVRFRYMTEWLRFQSLQPDDVADRKAASFAGTNQFVGAFGRGQRARGRNSEGARPETIGMRQSKDVAPALQGLVSRVLVVSG